MFVAVTRFEKEMIEVMRATPGLRQKIDKMLARLLAARAKKNPRSLRGSKIAA
jgi:hypothetical protein